ncbi:uncharacterized protein LOC119077900 [Bradysia coprophila]|uniref:uncharacterized protein LOC119077900 n=1 Tax=Bradysia coprophila TaxID=38358 RepID=UPI00187DBF18|nr:uncharacterized protein LOC119077900 [Bradysia coprophila]XP_037041166.1 uncharacterized protein LOC119077900 [Bradysia coprophila]
MGSSGEHFYYHYTSTAGANAIRNEGRLWSQSGVQLSTLNPEEHTRDAILRTIYGNGIPSERKNGADNVVYISEADLDSSKMFKITPTLYQYSGEIQVDAQNVKDKPRCVNGPSSSGSSSSIAQSSSELFFYTNTSNAQRIMNLRVIPYESNRSLFLTTMKPEQYFRDEILNTIYGRGYDRLQFAACADWCVKIDKTKLEGAKLRVSKQSGKVYEYTVHIAVNPADVMDKPQCTKNQRNSGDAHEYLYHYTSFVGAQAIVASGYLKKSGASGAFGAGVYMTKLKPTDFFRDDILKNNYGGINAAFKGRADWVVRIKKSGLIGSKLKTVPSNVTQDDQRQILVYEDIVNVQRSDVFAKPKCYRA